MAMLHYDASGKIDSQLWLNAENDLIEAIARAMCGRHGAQIFGYEAVTEEFLNNRWRCFECEARDAIAITRRYDANR